MIGLRHVGDIGGSEQRQLLVAVDIDHGARTHRLVDALESGELEKVVLTQRNRMRAVVVSLERFSELERRAAGGSGPERRAAA